MKYGMCSWSLKLDTIEAINYCGEAGFDGVTIPFNADAKLTDEAFQKKCMDAAKNAGVEISTIGMNVLCQISMCEPERDEEINRIFDDVLVICKNMGVKTLQVPSFGLSKHHSEEGFHHAVKSLKLLCEKAESYGVNIGSENVYTIEETKILLNEIKNDNLFLYYDGGNYNFEETLDCDIINEFHSLIKEIHVKEHTPMTDDALCADMGKGDSNLVKTTNLLKEKGYDGWVIFESNYSCLIHYKEVVARDLAFMKNILGNTAV